MRPVAITEVAGEAAAPAVEDYRSRSASSQRTGAHRRNAQNLNLNQKI